MLILHQQRPFTENKNGAGEDLYLSEGTRRRTTTGEDELGAGSEQSDRTAQPEEQRGRRGEESRKRKAEGGEWKKALIYSVQLPPFRTTAFELVQLPTLRTTAFELIQKPPLWTTTIELSKCRRSRRRQLTQF